MTHTVALVGLGRIAWRGFTENHGAETHLDGISAHPGSLRLVAGVDTDASRRLQFQDFTGARVYETLSDALKDAQPSIVVIATPVETHRLLVIEAAAFQSVRAILCEKPMAPSVAECREMIAACAGKVLQIGHQRRYERNHILATQFIRSGALGEPLAGSAEFPGGGGWLNNGSHAADGLHMLLGNHLPISLHANNTNTFSLTCICENGKLTIESYRSLHAGYMKAAYADLLECIDTGSIPYSGGYTGMEAVREALAAKELDEAAA